MRALVIADDHLIAGHATPALRPAEWRLACILATEPMQILPWDHIYDALWPGEQMSEPAQIYSHASRLRAALASAQPGASDIIETVPRRGLRLLVQPRHLLILAAPSDLLDDLRGLPGCHV